MPEHLLTEKAGSSRLLQAAENRTNSAGSSSLPPSPTERSAKRMVTAMFEDVYGLKRSPFTRDIPTRELYLPGRLEEIIGRLEYAAERQFFAVVTGDAAPAKLLPSAGLKKRWIR